MINKINQTLFWLIKKIRLKYTRFSRCDRFADNINHDYHIYFLGLYLINSLSFLYERTSAF